MAAYGGPEDGALIERLKRRDPQALAELYDRYGRMAYSLVLRVVRDKAIAEICRCSGKIGWRPGEIAPVTLDRPRGGLSPYHDRILAGAGRRLGMGGINQRLRQGTKLG